MEVLELIADIYISFSSVFHSLNERFRKYKNELYSAKKCDKELIDLLLANESFSKTLSNTINAEKVYISRHKITNKGILVHCILLTNRDTFINSCDCILPLLLNKSIELSPVYWIVNGGK